MTAPASAPPDVWADACLAAACVANDPAGFGGVRVKARPGPVRDAWLAMLKSLLPPGTPWRRVPVGIADDGLLGGVDLAATLSAGRTVLHPGVLAAADGGILVVPSAERLDRSIAARIAQALDTGEVALAREGQARRLPARVSVVALDEGGGDPDGEAMPSILAERLAFCVDLDGVSYRDAAPDASPSSPQERIATAPNAVIEAMVGTAAAFGIDSLRPPLWAVRAAVIIAAVRGRDAVTEDDAIAAARLVLAHRARQLPPDDAGPDAPEAEPPTGERPESEGEDAAARPDALQDAVVAAVQAALPQGLLALARAASRTPGQAAGRTAGNEQDALRGRPKGVRSGRLRGGVRIALADTLRAAAPWQAVRRREPDADAGRIAVRLEDIRLRRFVRPREAAIVFCVDASGSAAFARLAEAKGAIELLLAEAYVARTHVGLVAFRGAGAETLLPPTRSLARAKALLATLPGGGGTPLAAGLDAACAMALSERGKGRTPLVIVLTDGRANVAADGAQDRGRATADAEAAAARLRVAGLQTLLIDISPRENPSARALAASMGGRYIALPSAQAGAMHDAIAAALPAA